VRALVRRVDRGSEIAARGAELVPGDLADPGALRELVADSAAVIHAAGAVRGGSQRAFDAVNVDGTAAVIEAVRALTDHPRLLLLSSLAAREPQLSWYAKSKRAAEALLERESTLDWIILRPPAVYGPGDREMLPVFRLMSRGLATVPGSPEARLSLIHVSDLVRAVVACLETAATRHQTLSLCDGKPGGYDWRELAAMTGAVAGRPVRLWAVPAPLLDLVARINLSLASVTGRAPMLTPPKLRELRHPDWVVDNADITDLTGWQPAVGLRAGLSELLAPAK
jgi:nucleoside-diphosphate-sugar epimerase